MAQPSTLTNEVRARVTRLVRDAEAVGGLVNLIEDTGANDAERLAFFESFFDTQEGYDIDISDFTAAVAALRDLESWLDTNRPALAKLWR